MVISGCSSRSVRWSSCVPLFHPMIYGSMDLMDSYVMHQVLEALPQAFLQTSIGARAHFYSTFALFPSFFQVQLHLAHCQRQVFPSSDLAAGPCVNCRCDVRPA